MAEDFFAGYVGGCAGVLVGHPFDTIKVRLQTQDCNNRIYRGSFHCLSTIIKHESFQGLYKGMSSPMMGVAVINAIVFGVYGNTIRATSSPDSHYNQFFAGCVAGFVQSFVTSPIEFAKTRMQLQGQADPNFKLYHMQSNRHFYKSPLDCLKKTFRNDGLFGIYRGLGCTILRDAPSFGVYFSSYEFLTKLAADSKGNVSTVAVLWVGGLAGVLCWTATYPLDVMKSRLQGDGMDGSEKKYKNLWDCTKKSYKSEGLNVFTKGLALTLLRAFPTNAATFAVFTWTIMILESSFKSKLAVEDAKNVLLLDKEIR